MKNSSKLYVLSLFLLAVAGVLVLEFGDSQRLQALAGVAAYSAIALNIVSYIWGRQQASKEKANASQELYK